MRGLKSRRNGKSELLVMSHPVRGAWIEIMLLAPVISLIRSHPVRGAWIEMSGMAH